MTLKNLFIPTLIAFTILIGCEASQDQVLEIGDYSNLEFQTISAELNLPENLLDYNFIGTDDLVQTNHKATLGRVLFYDKNLSADGKISCASCHQQSLAFADDKSFSHGVNSSLTKRNSIALGSLKNFGTHYDNSNEDRITPGLFWDERAVSIKEQLKQTINNPNEMGMELGEIVTLIENKDYYQILFKKAYDTEAINEDNILESLEAFINSIGSTNTKFESTLIQDLNYITGDSVVGSIDNEQGFSLFLQHCSSCHSNTVQLPLHDEALGSIHIANNGLKIKGDDLGVYSHTLDPKDIGKFKVPGLRNIELTGPYMHDGRFETLEEVVEFYNSEIEMSENLHPLLRSDNKAKRLNLSEDEKTSLVIFLKSMTGTQITTEVKWSDPFIY